MNFDFVKNKKITSLFITQFQFDFSVEGDINFSVESEITIKQKGNEGPVWKNSSSPSNFNPVNILGKKILSGVIEENFLKLELENDVELKIGLDNNGLEALNISYDGKIIILP